MRQALDVDAAMENAGYRIESVAGRGGMGTVYRAIQLSLQREVALKLLAQQLAADHVFRERFLRESTLAASLEHPNIVPIYDAGEIDGLLFIAMRYVPGSDLQALIRREGRLSAHVSIAVVEQIAAALDAAHALRLVHRDVKPSNVLIAAGGGAEAPLHALLGDFGLSIRLDDTAERPTERRLGTVHYMAPEQIRGEDAGPRADVYSLGCLLYECLTARVPFPRNSEAAVLYAHLEAPPPRLHDLDLDLPNALDDVIAMALAKSPSDRPGGAGELARAAANALGRTQLPISPRAGPTADPAQLAPAVSDRRTSRGIVGRRAESEELADALDDALAGAGGVVTLGGDPGIGKTTLARELCERAELAGIPAVWAFGLDAEAAPAYWHWIQVMRGLARRRDAREVFAAVGSAAGWLRLITPDLDKVLPQLDVTSANEGRFQIYDALARLLESASARSGLLVVLDDLHLADEASLLALSFIARVLSDKRIVVLGTHRDVELERSREHGPPLSELLRPARRIALQGLRAADAHALIEARLDDQPSAALVGRIHAVTGGNPLFICELLALLEAEGQLEDPGLTSTELPLPARVRDAISARLALLSPKGREVLSVASVIGERFRAPVLSAAAARPGLELLELLDEAVRLRLLRPLTDPPDGYAFYHGLIKATLYEGLPRSRCLLLHKAVGEALERVYDVAAGEGLAEVAHHFLVSAPLDGQERAIAYASRAGGRAVEKFAYDQAVGLYARALRLCVPGAAEGIALAQALGEAQMRAGDTTGARATLVQGAEAALGHDDPVALGCATLACGIWGLTAGYDDELVRLAEVAVDQLEGGEHLLLLARLKGFMAAALHWSDELERRTQLAADALGLARAEHERSPSADSARTLAYVLGRYLLACWGPESAERDLPLSDELLALSKSLRDSELELLTRNWRISVLLELGRFGSVDQEIARVEHMANELRQPRAMVFLPLHYAIQAARRGSFADAERHNALSAEIGQRVRGSVGELAAAAQLFTIRLQQGRLPEFEGPLRAVVSLHPEMVAFQSALATLFLQDRRPSEAREELELLTARGLAGFPRDSTHIIMLALTAEVAAELGAADKASALYGWLKPYSGRWVVSPGAAAIWPVDRSLGRLATVTGRETDALDHIARARKQSQTAGALPCVALTMLDEARALLARGRSDDLSEIVELASLARTMAQEMGMGAVVDLAILTETEAHRDLVPSRPQTPMSR